MSEVVFDMIPVIQDSSKVEITFVRLVGINLKHGSPSTDLGRVYATIAPWHDDTIVVSLHSGYPLSDENKIADANILKTDLGDIADLNEVNSSGVSGQITIASYAGATQVVLIVSFATDEDVISEQQALANYPGYEPAIGLSIFHAQAMRELLTSVLPSIMPHLFGGKPINTFVPLALSEARLPDLTKIINPDAIRQSQARLVEFHSASQKKYLEEWNAIATAARDEYARVVTMLKDANAPVEAATEAADTSIISFGSFTRE